MKIKGLPYAIYGSTNERKWQINAMADRQDALKSAAQAMNTYVKIYPTEIHTVEVEFEDRIIYRLKGVNSV